MSGEPTLKSRRLTLDIAIPSFLNDPHRSSASSIHPARSLWNKDLWLLETPLHRTVKRSSRSTVPSSLRSSTRQSPTRSLLIV